ncbi:MAG: sugar kinase [Chloroflexota bacterium]|nr:sugar kinase [Chloroflexota bacterium]
MPDILSLGECMVEFFAEEPLAEAKNLQKAFAGDALNLLAAASRLGSTCGFLSRVGDDPFQNYLLNGWESLGIDTSHVKRVQGRNGIYFISIYGYGERDFTYYRAGSAPSTMTPEDLDPDYIAQARVLHISGIAQAISASARATALAAARIAHEAHVCVSFDPNFRPALWSAEEARAAAEELLPHVDIALPSGPEESQQLFGLTTPQETADYLHGFGAYAVVVKLGEAGVYVSAEGGTGTVPAFTVPHVVDTTGAGDAFDGAFLHGLVQNMPPLDAARLGVVMAGLKVRGRGAIASLPEKSEVEAALAAWERKSDMLA